MQFKVFVFPGTEKEHNVDLQISTTPRTKYNMLPRL